MKRTHKQKAGGLSEPHGYLKHKALQLTYRFKKDPKGKEPYNKRGLAQYRVQQHLAENAEKEKLFRKELEEEKKLDALANPNKFSMTNPAYSNVRYNRNTEKKLKRNANLLAALSTKTEYIPPKKTMKPLHNYTETEKMEKRNANLLAALGSRNEYKLLNTRGRTANVKPAPIRRIMTVNNNSFNYKNKKYSFNNNNNIRISYAPTQTRRVKTTRLANNSYNTTTNNTINNKNYKNNRTRKVSNASTISRPESISLNNVQNW